MTGYFLSQNLGTLRRQANLTQEQISRHLHIQRQTYCNYELGLRTPPIEIVVALADLFHVSLDTLVRKEITELPREQSAARRAEFETMVEEYRSLPADSQKEVIAFISFKHFFTV